MYAFKALIGSYIVQWVDFSEWLGHTIFNLAILWRINSILEMHHGFIESVWETFHAFRANLLRI